MSHLKVISPGAYTTVQDLGRSGYLRIGVPPSGALDPVSLRLANSLVSNPQDAACLEIIYIGPDLIIEAESARLGVVGAGSYIDVLEPEPQRIPEGQSITLPRGARCRVMTSGGAASCYLAVHGGFDLPSVMGSQSTYARGGFGGIEGRPLKENDTLPLLSGHAPEGPDVAYKSIPNPVPDGDPQIRLVLGPQDDHFSEHGIETLLNEGFTFSKSSDRMGARLEGPALEVTDFENFISDGITAGAVQVPGSGQPIVLLADHQTSGGYPKIATVISTDLPIFGRIKPGVNIHFKAVDVDEAEDLRRDLERSIKAAVKSLAPVGDQNQINLDQLYDSNIISGMISGAEE